MKRLSIIIPVYKVEKYIRACLESVLDQSIPVEDLEVILVNDGTPDRSVETIQDLIVRYPKTIQVIEQQNSGVSVARNTGINHATGNYILFLDSDDLLQNDSLSSMLQVAEESEADMVRGKYMELYDEQIDNLKNEKTLNVNFTKKEYPSHDAYINLFHPRFGFCWIYLISRNLIVNNDLKFEPGVGFMEDFAFVISLFLNSKKFVDTSINFYIYRKSDYSCTSTMTVYKLLSAVSALRVVYQQIPLFQGKIKSKIISDLCYNVKIVVWFVTHYKSIYPFHEKIVKSVLEQLNDLPKYAVGKDRFLLKLLYSYPFAYLCLNYCISIKKY